MFSLSITQYFAMLVNGGNIEARVDGGNALKISCVRNLMGEPLVLRDISPAKI